MIKLVTGANGYIGRYVVSELLEKGYKVRAFVKNGTDLSLLKGKCEIVKGDILVPESLDKAMKGCDIVIHLAAIVGSPASELNKGINFDGTTNIVEASKNNKVKRIIYTSSISAVRKKRGPYGQTKIDSEEIVMRSGIPYTIFRPTLVYGLESQGLKRIVANIVRFPMIIPMVGRGKYFRQPVYVRDVARIITKCIDTNKTLNKTYNLGGGKRLRFVDLVKKVSGMLGIRKLVIPIPLFLCKLMGRIFQLFPKPIFTLEHIRGLSEDTIVDISSLEKDLDYRPVPLDIGLTEVIKEMGYITLDSPE